ncbi:hypothetical protein N781_11620 [Pontibacillus halophilus JSM 076056 = DSM 19796]|uniref:Aromatic acid exporter family protein n=1 Tax=Pontibacillus halophilus JSM 076056 = DSM 19796 TaxID=1385510 RepID=A0A0A5G924_9BACI|nr:aromatic acid exporter family protein [Pontibacillus halophilus]KGX87683.1 hypothetical protein N781_11620 [Pontibacillus halophilus JSM 076056 = DSM 19796]
MKVGARMLKTGLAVALALYVASLIGASSVFAGVAALFSIQPSIYRSYQSIVEQVQANIIGALSAFIVVLTLGNDPFIIGFTMVIVIGVCIRFNLNENTILLALVAVIAIMETTDMPFLQFTGIRFTALMLGVFASFIVNLFFLPPKYETKLFQKLEKTTEEVLQWLRVTTRHMNDRPSLNEEIDRLQQEIVTIDHTYSLYKEERNYFKKARYQKARKLIVFRRMTLTLKDSFDVLKSFSRLEKEMDRIPPEFRKVLVEELDEVIHSHEKMMLTIMGRIRVGQKDEQQIISEPDIPKLVDSLIDLYEDQPKNEDKLMLLPLATKLMDYHRQLQKFKRITFVYQNHHPDERIKTK